jgi:ribonuclease HII
MFNGGEAGHSDDLFDYDEAESTGADGLLAGVDEAGRGPLAGPVVAAAVILCRQADFPYLNDSKQLTPNRREQLYQKIVRYALVGVGVVDEKKIDAINIYQASRLAMKQAVLDLPVTPNRLFIDGNLRLELPIRQKSIIKGDQKSAAIAAASIVAKVYRDAWMRHLDEIYPGYGFTQHKGYGTRLHLEKIESKGPSPVHRKTFAPFRLSPKELFYETSAE